MPSSIECGKELNLDPDQTSKFAHWKKSTYFHRARKLTFIALIIFALFAVVSWAFLPSYLHKTITAVAAEKIGRKIDIGAIHFSPFTLRTSFDAITLYEVDGKTPALKVKEAAVNLSLSSVFHRALVLDEILIDQFDMHLVRTSVGNFSRYNYTDILERLESTPKNDSPVRFSIANIQVKNSQLRFTDDAVGKEIAIKDIQIGLPFVSNFPSAIQSFVQPAFSAQVNGARFSLKARSKPFVDDLDTSLAMDISGLDLTEYIPYSPVALPFTLSKARLSTKLDLTFSRKKKINEILLGGDVRVDQVAIQDQAATPLLNVETFAVKLKQVNVLNASGEVEKISLTSPEIWLDMDKKGLLNVAKLMPQKSPSEAQAQTAKSNNITKDAKSQANLLLADLTVAKGQIHWRDDFFAQPNQMLEVRNVELNVKNLSSKPDARPAQITTSAELGTQQKLSMSGEFHPLSLNAMLDLKSEGIRINDFQSYLNPYVNAKVEGEAQTQLMINRMDGKLKFSDISLQVQEFKLSPRQKAGGQLQFKAFNLKKMNADLEQQLLDVDGLTIDGLNAEIIRDSQATIGLMNILRQASAPAVATSIPSASSITRSALANQDVAPKNSAKQWRVNLRDANVNAAAFSLVDVSVSPTVKGRVDNLMLKVDQINSELTGESRIDFSAQFNRLGRLALSANATQNFNKLNIDVDGKALPVSLLSPYLAPILKMDVQRGNLDIKGKTNVLNLVRKSQGTEKDASKEASKQTLQASFVGGVKLDGFKFLQPGELDDFLEWKSISIEKIDANFGGIDQTLTSLSNLESLNIGRLSLNDFFAKLVLSEKGVLNLQGAAQSTAPNNKAEADASKSPAETAVETKAEPAASHSAQVLTPKKPTIRIGEILLKGGNINFTDNFIKPNYVANLTDINGRVAAIASDMPQPASLELLGKIDRDAPVKISGTVNPLRSPIFLDMKGSANGIELTRLTPYAAKYAGYGIEKGKLTVQVSYHLEGEQLRAENEVTLDQLTFGARIENPNATRLPVLLAVALLKDNDGRISINLPISGSLSDPQFSVGGIIFKVFVNLITKAVTSPFALLGSLFGGGEELAYVEFQDGTSELSTESKTKLDSLAKALKNRAALKLDITGRADEKTDSDALRLQIIDRKVRALKFRDAQKIDKNVLLNELAVTQADRQKYLSDIYQAEKISKPRNALGLAKTLPPEQMMELLLNNIPIGGELLRELAQKRADNVRDYLQKEAEVGSDRMFLIAPKLNAEGIQDKGKPNRVDFSLK